MKVKFLQQFLNIEALHGVKSTVHYLNFHNQQVIEPIGVTNDMWDNKLITITYKSFIFTIKRDLVEISL